MLWNSIPAQLAKENKKFIYGLVKDGARAKDYEMALLWLQDCGLVHRVNRINTPKLPLKAYEDLKAFKLFVLDIGLMSCMSALRQKTVIEGDKLFAEFKGALTEQYVLQQMIVNEDYNIFYWSNERGTNEIDFLVDDGCDLVPVEVKAEENLSAKSLRAFYDKYKPNKAVRTSMSGYREEEWMINIPLYCIGSGWDEIKQ
jgi:predicted AAA+ superfamily ATPase